MPGPTLGCARPRLETSCWGLALEGGSAVAQDAGPQVACLCPRQEAASAMLAGQLGEKCTWFPLALPGHCPPLPFTRNTLAGRGDPRRCSGLAGVVVFPPFLTSSFAIGSVQPLWPPSDCDLEVISSIPQD